MGAPPGARLHSVMGNTSSRRSSARASTSEYPSSNNDASSLAAEAIAVGVPVAEETAMPANSAKKLDLVFTMDCTGSMGAYIEAAKQGITRITERLAQAEGYNLRYSLVAYRDHPPQDSSMRMRRAAAEEHVALEEDTISMEQVSRLYGRGKKQGLW